MKKLIPILIVCAMLIASPAMAAKYKITYQYDLIKLDSKLLKEPPGELKIEVEISGPGKEEPFTKQHLRDAAQGYLAKVRESIEKDMKGADDALKKPGVSKKQIGKINKKLNSKYKKKISNALKTTKNLILKDWQDLVKKDNDLKDWKIDTSFEIAKDTYGVVTTSIETVGTGGLALIKNIVSLVDSSISIVQNVYKLAQGEKSARKDLEKSIENVQAKLAGRQSVWQKIRDAVQGQVNVLEKNIETYDQKLTGIRKEAQKLASRLEVVLNRQDDLNDEFKKATNKDLKKALQKVIAKTEGMAAETLKMIDQINDSRAKGAALKKIGKRLQKEAAKSETTVDEVREGTKKVYEAYKQVNDLMDPVGLSVNKSLDTLKELAKAASDTEPLFEVK